MFWALLGGALGAAPKDASAEQAITAFAAVTLVYVWTMYFHLKRQQAKRRERRTKEST